MKRFEHEVLEFETRSPKQKAKMKETLREWGFAGFEIVGVTQQHDAAPVTVYLKREVLDDNGTVENAA